MRFKCPPPPNPLGISEHDRRPREAIQLEQKKLDLLRKQQQLEYEAAFKGKVGEEKKWTKFYKLPDKLHEVGTAKRHELPERSEFVDPITVIAKSLRDDVVYGKPLFQKYARPLKPEDLNIEMGGIHKLFKVLH